MNTELFDTAAMASAPSQLVLARRRQAELTHQLETLIDEGEEMGDGLFEHSEDFRRIKRQLREVEAIVATEEAIEKMRKEGR